MAVANGFGKVVTSGSVFMYDTGDTVNSYIGEPTTNLAGTNAARTIGFHNQGAYGNAGSISDAPEKGPGWKKITVNNRGNNFRIAQFPYTSLTAGITYSYSLEIDMGTTSGYYWRIDGSGGYGAITIQNNKVVTTITPSAGVYAIFLHHNTTGVSGISEVIYYRYYQVEQNSHATQFTEGTRSSTQGLLPIVGNSTINLSNVSFDSNAQMTFDGTDDKIDVSYYSQVNNSLSRSWEVIVRPTANLSYAGIFGNKLGYGCSFYCNGGIYLWDGNWVFNWYDNSSYQFLYSYSPPSVNSYTHIVGTYDATDQKPRIYVNGELKATYGSSTNMNYGGETYVIDIGWNSKDGGLHYFQGQIPITKYYQGKALSSSEVKQNYNKYKTRFNLS